MRGKRAGIDADQRQGLDAAINRHLLQYVASSGTRVVAAYVAFDGEPDLLPALRHMHGQGTRIALPRIGGDGARSKLEFRQWLEGCTMEANRYGIPEPTGTLEIHLAEIDLLLLPLVGWDPQGGRLGMGASFYDRLLQPLAASTRPHRLGVAYELQRTTSIPLDPWDVRLHGIVTEKGYFTFEA